MNIETIMARDGNTFFDVRLCRVSSSFFDQTYEKIANDPLILNTMKAFKQKDPKFFSSSFKVVFHDDKIGLNIEYFRKDPTEPSNKPMAFNFLNIESFKQIRSFTDECCRGTMLSDIDEFQKKITIRDLCEKDPLLKIVDVAQKQDNDEKFLDRYGRDRYSGEPPGGWETKLFQTNGNDDGFCVINGLVFDRNDIGDPVDNKIVFGTYWDGRRVTNEICNMNLPPDAIGYLNRNEFKKRSVMAIRIREDQKISVSPMVILENVLSTERFFNQKIPENVLPGFYRKTARVKLRVRVDPETKKDCLTLMDTSERIAILSKNPTKKNFDVLMAKILLRDNIKDVFDICKKGETDGNSRDEWSKFFQYSAER